MLKTLPPREVDTQDAILFVLVGSQKGAVKESSLLRAPRSEYAAAVECLRQMNPFYAEVTLGDGGDDLLEGCVLETAEDSALAKELLQKGPAGFTVGAVRVKPTRLDIGALSDFP